MAEIERKTKRYPTDLTDEAWDRIEPLLPPRSKRGRRREVDLREIMNAIRYLVRTGCGWRMLPNDFPAWETVYWWFRRFVRQLLFRTIHDVSLMLDRERTGREASPSAGILDSQSVKAPAALTRIRLDTYIGMGLSNMIALFIIITTAATLNAGGITDIQTSTQAAEALRPLAGPFAFALFAMGIIGTGLLAIPVLAGSAAYAVGEACRWPTGLARQPLDAKAFYVTLAIATSIGVAMNFMAIDPIKALFWSAVVNGVVAVPVMIIVMIMAMRKRIMGRFTIPRGLVVLGWLATLVMAATVTGMAATSF